MRSLLITTLILALASLLTACPPAGNSSSGTTSNSSQPSQAGTAPALKAQGISICLVRSDLGLGDGNFVREVDALLDELAQDGELSYLPAGEMPAELLIEASEFDVGLAGDGSEPGSMTRDAAVELLNEVQPCDWLVVCNPYLVTPALERISAGTLEAKALIVLDEEGWIEPDAEPQVPVIRVRYSIKDVAFLLGVAAAQSANNGQFVALANATDPQSDDFLDAVAAGAKYQTNGAVTLTATLSVDPETGIVRPADFRETMEDIKKTLGSAYAANHFIIALGRATPTIMYSLTQEPHNGYVLGAYSDYRQVRPARVVGCAVKHPGVAMKYLLEHAATPEDLASLAPDGFIELGLPDDAVGFTDFELYSRYNPDGDDIRDAVAATENRIRFDELDYPY